MTTSDGSKRCKQLLDELMEYSCSPEFVAQMHVAREVFEMACGKVNDDDSFYDTRMVAFQEFFVFDFRLSSVFPGSTVFENFLLNAQTQLSPVELHDYEQLRNHRYSLFFVDKYRADSIVIKDLIAKRTETVYPFPDTNMLAFDTSQVFQSRLIRFNDRSYLTGTLIFHPKEVRGFIEKYVNEFLLQNAHTQGTMVTDWRTELQRRHELLAGFAEQRRKVEQASRKRAIDLLNVTKHLSPTFHVATSPHLVMAAGTRENVSPFVPESPFYHTAELLQRLAYMEIRTHRYKHIEPLKIYSGEPVSTSAVPGVTSRVVDVENVSEATG